MNKIKAFLKWYIKGWEFAMIATIVYIFFSAYLNNNIILLNINHYGEATLEGFCFLFYFIAKFILKIEKVLNL